MKANVEVINQIFIVLGYFRQPKYIQTDLLWELSSEVQGTTDSVMTENI